MKNVIELGDLVKDLITSFEGVVTSYSKWCYNVDTTSKT